MINTGQSGNIQSDLQNIDEHSIQETNVLVLAHLFLIIEKLPQNHFPFSVHTAAPNFTPEKGIPKLQCKLTKWQMMKKQVELVVKKLFF